MDADVFHNNILSLFLEYVASEILGDMHTIHIQDRRYSIFHDLHFFYMPPSKTIIFHRGYQIIK